MYNKLFIVLYLNYTKMRFELPGYDVNYRYDEHHNTSAGKIITELHEFLEKNGIKGGLYCLDEKGQVVRRYTDRVVLEIDDSVSGENLERIKKIVLKLLRVMGATESQLVDVFKDEIDKEREIESTKETIATLEKSISAMNPKTQEEWNDYDRKAATLREYREKLNKLTHSEK